MWSRSEARSPRRSRNWNWWFTLGAALWLLTAGGVFAAAWIRDDMHIPWLVAGYLALTVLTSVACFVAYGVDKRRAIRQAQRIPEYVLHRLALAGGWPGAALAQSLFRHKTQKMSFRLKYWLIVLLHGAIIGYGAYRLWQGDAPQSTPNDTPTQQAAILEQAQAGVRFAAMVTPASPTPVPVLARDGTMTAENPLRDRLPRPSPSERLGRRDAVAVR